MPASYKIVLTPLAKAAAEKCGSAAALEAEVRAQIRHLVADEMSYANMMFHTFEMAGQEYICTPEKMDGEIVLRVDTCSRWPARNISVRRRRWTEKSSCGWIPAAAETQSPSRRGRSPVKR